MLDKIDEALARGLIIIYARRLEVRGGVAEGMKVTKIEGDEERAE